MTRILAIYLTLLFLLPSVISAEPLFFDLSEHSPSNAAVRSLILPGWGQHFNGEAVKGNIVGVSAAVSVLGAYLLNEQANRTYADYEKAGLKNGPLYSDYENQQQQAMIVSLVAVGVWAYGVVDAYLVGRAPVAEVSSSDGVHFDVHGRDMVGLMYTARF